MKCCDDLIVRLALLRHFLFDFITAVQSRLVNWSTWLPLHILDLLCEILVVKAVAGSDKHLSQRPPPLGSADKIKAFSP